MDAQYYFILFLLQCNLNTHEYKPNTDPLGWLLRVKNDKQLQNKNR